MRSVVVGSKQSSIRAVSSLDIRPAASSIVLGYVGENQATCVVWPGMADAWRRLYGGGKIEGAHQRYGDGGPYPIVLTETDAGDVVWTLSASDLVREGAGALELSFFKDGVLAKSKQWRTIVLPSITGGGTVDPPEPQKSWVDAVLAAGVQASASASAAAASAEKAEAALPHAPVIDADGAWSVWDATEGAYKSTGVSATGPQGPQGETGPQGEKGPQGPKGEDGKTPEYGVDYGTPEQIQGIAQSAADILQPELNQIKNDLSAEQMAREEADNALRADLNANANADAVTRRSLDTLWKLNQGITYEFQADNAEVYSKIVPSGAKLASVETIGGHTESIDGELVSAVVESVVDRGQNLFDKSTVIQGKYITSTGGIHSNVKSYLSDYISCRDFTDVSINKGGGIAWYGDDGVVLGFIGGKSTSTFRTYTKPSGAVKFQFDMPINLLGDVSTVMCVAGVYTAQTIPSFTPYKTPTTYTIPAAVRSLPGYGWSAGEVCNAIERTDTGWQYVQRVGSRVYQEGDIVTDGVTTYYVLDNPVITDITDLMADFPAYFEVEAGGTITMENAAMLDVPSTEKYLIALAEVNG